MGRSWQWPARRLGHAARLARPDGTGCGGGWFLAVACDGEIDGKVLPLAAVGTVWLNDGGRQRRIRGGGWRERKLTGRGLAMVAGKRR
jgi:hypothetical protein